MVFMVNRNLVFIDSMQFMNSGLDSLVENLVDEDFKYLSKEFNCECLELVKKKAVYPYEYVNSFKRFNEIELSSKGKFFSSLKGPEVSEEDYEHAKNVWNTFGIKAWGEYHDRYLKTDVLLLCDVFEKFIGACLNYYGLDPCHYFSVPGLGWNAMLKMTGVELKLIDDIEMYLFIEKVMRGAISYIAKRHSKANNKRIDDRVNAEKSNYIMHFDANNLSGWAMTQYLPYGDFKWMSEEEISDFNVNLIEANSGEGYILEVDLEYRSELHDLHNDYPLASEKIKVNGDMLSRYCSETTKKYGITVGEVNKLVPNLVIRKIVLFITGICSYICRLE